MMNEWNEASTALAQPFGFTWHDVDMLRAASQFLRAFNAEQPDPLPFHGDMLGTVADRIAALLPPRDP